MIAVVIVGHLVFDVIAAVTVYVLHHHSMDKLKTVLLEIAGENLRLRHVIKQQFRQRNSANPNRFDEYQNWLADPRSRRSS